MRSGRLAALRFVALAAASLEAGVAGAQDESLDDLFDDPVEDVVLAQTDIDHLAQYTTDTGIRWGGNFNAVGGVSAGWTAWPDPSDLTAGFDGLYGLVPKATMYADARPDPDFRFYGSVVVTMDPLNGQATWDVVSINELFIDYTWLGQVFVRLGKHDIAWGQARLFEGYTDLMADAIEGFSLRASMPTWLDGVSALVLVNDEEVFSYRQVTYAGKAELILLGGMLSVGARWQIDAGLDALVSLKKVAWHTDLFADIEYHGAADSRYAKVLAGFYREWDDLKLYGEYWYDGSNPSYFDQTFGVAFGYNNLGATTIDLGLQWIHTFVDNSGIATAGITWKPWKFIEATIAVPVAYGADASRYATSYNTDPGKRRIALVFGLEMDVSF